MVRARNLRQASWFALVLLLAQLASGTPGATESKRVVLLHSFGREFQPWSDYSKAIRTELQRQSPWLVEISDHSLSSRGDDEGTERAFVEYLRVYYAKRTPDLIMSIG